MEPNGSNSRKYDLEERTYEFARDVRAFVKQLPRTLSNIEDAKQLVNASGSVGSNYIEANEALSKRDFSMRAKICRKEAKESRYWLRLVYTDARADLERSRESLMQEAGELTNTYSAQSYENQHPDMRKQHTCGPMPRTNEFRALLFGFWDLFRVSDFGFRIL